MFLASTLLVTCVAYALAALVAEVVLDSPAERSLDPMVRAGFGLILALVFFSGFWFLMPAPHVLALGAVLLCLYAYSRSGRDEASGVATLVARLVAHGRPLAAVMACALLFFVPLLISCNLGPFTEGGGDISIYADTAKYLYDRDLTEYGVPPQGPAGYLKNLEDAVGIAPYDRHASIDPSLLNPPTAEYASYRILLARVMSPFFYAPYAMFSFLAGETNYPVFYGLLALAYALVLGSVWSFFRPFGRPVALAAGALVASSHGLASVFFNVYAAQSFSLAISALVLAALPRIRPLSAAGFRIYGAALVYTLGCYTHYLAVIGPMVAAGLFLSRDARPGDSGARRGPRRLIAAVPLLFLVAAMLLVAVGSKESFTLMVNLVSGTFMKANNAYMGDAAPLFSLRWNAFALGILSQQHFHPYMAQFDWIMTTVAAAAAAGAGALLIGAATMARAAFAKASGGPRRNDLIVYGAALFVCLANLAVVGASLYTQAKGAQNLLVYLYAAMLLPLAVGRRALGEGMKIRAWVGTLTAFTLAFGALMLVLRVEQAARLGFGKDRSGVTEVSYFSEARRILAVDKDALVLMEPRNSADLYTTIQPFFGARMVPVKHLSLQTIEYPVKPASEPTRITRTVMLPDLIAPADVPHLWYLRAQREKRAFPPRTFEYTWNARRLSDLREPTLFLSANDFEVDFGKRPLERDSGREAMFSFLRYGAAMLYVPADSSGVVTARMEPREAADHAALSKEVAQEIASGKLPAGTVVEDGATMLTLTLALAPQPNARLVTIARYSGEYWLSVELGALRRAKRD